MTEEEKKKKKKTTDSDFLVPFSLSLSDRDEFSWHEDEGINRALLSIEFEISAQVLGGLVELSEMLMTTKCTGVQGYARPANQTHFNSNRGRNAASFTDMTSQNLLNI